MKLTVDNSECRIEGLSIEQHKALKELLSYTLNPTAQYFSGGYGPKKQSLLSVKGSFPTGLLYLVKKYLKDDHIKYEIVDNRIVPKPQEGLFTMSLGFTPYPEQEAAAKAVKRFGRGIVVAPTGTGKSLICALIINELQVNTLVVVPSLELKRQITGVLQEIFSTDKVGKDKAIWVQNVDSLDPKKAYSQYDCIIIDEFHHAGAKSYRKLNKTAFSKSYYKVGLTATPFRSQDNERLLLESVLSQVIYRIDYQQAVDKGYIVPMEAYYYELPKTKTSGTTWAKVYSELVVNNMPRNALIAGIISSLKQNDISTLCLVKEIKHGEALSELSSVHFANGQSEDSKDLISFFNKGKLKALIGTTGVLGEGVDTKPAEFIIIGGLGKSKNSFMQQVGRGFRKYLGKESCKIILFLDRSHKWTKEHFKAQYRYLLEEYGIVPSKIGLTE